MKCERTAAPVMAATEDEDVGLCRRRGVVHESEKDRRPDEGKRHQEVRRRGSLPEKLGVGIAERDEGEADDERHAHAERKDGEEPQTKPDDDKGERDDGSEPKGRRCVLAGSRDVRSVIELGVLGRPRKGSGLERDAGICEPSPHGLAPSSLKASGASEVSGSSSAAWSAVLFTRPR